MARALLIRGDQASLQFGDRDIELMHESCERLQVDAAVVTGSRTKIDAELIGFLKDTIDDETLIIYYTGHAIIRRGKAFLKVGAGQGLNDLLPLPSLIDTLSDVNSRNVVLVLDCCSAGAAIRELKIPGRDNCSMFLASETLDPVKEDEILEASVFTYHIHKVVIGNAQQLIDNGFYLLSKLADAVKASIAQFNAVQDNPAPLPVLSSMVSHDVKLGNANANREEDTVLRRLVHDYVTEFMQCAESCNGWCQSDRSWCNTVVKSEICMDRFVPPSIKEYQRKEVQRVRLTDFVNRWLSDDTSYMGILGEMGIGKTSACLYIFYLICERFDDRTGLVPVYIPLDKDVVQQIGKASVFEVIRDCMGGDFRAADVRNLAGQHRLVVLLDGFDEIGKDQSTNAILANYELLKKLFRLRNKTILTCRTHFFAEQDQLEEVLTGRVPGTDLSTAMLDSDEYPFDLVEVLELSEDEIIKLIGLLSDEQDARALWEKICSVYDLKDLAKRAILLKMIVRVWPEIEKAKTEVTSASLYTRYTRSLLLREVKERRVGMDIGRKERFIGYVASLMYRKGTQTVSGEELDQEIREYFQEVPEGRFVFNNIAYDCKVSTFFSRDRTDCYRFMHKSFYEYYFARHCLEEALSGTFDGWNIEWFPREVAKFISELIQEDRYRLCIRPILQKALSQADSVTRWNAIHILSLLEAGDISDRLNEKTRSEFIRQAWIEEDIVLVRQYCRVIAKFIDRDEAEKLIDKIITVARRDRKQDAENDRTYTNYYGGVNAACTAFVRHLKVPSPKYDAKLHLYMLEHIANSGFADAILEATSEWDNEDAYASEIGRAINQIQTRAGDSTLII